MKHEFKGTKNWHIRFIDKSDPEAGFFIEADSVNGRVCKQEVMAEDFGNHNGYTLEKRLADAKLIEVAPEMFEEIKHLVRALKTVSSFGATKPIIEHAEQLLTKATQLP